MKRSRGIEIVVTRAFELCGDSFAPGDKIFVSIKLADQLIQNGQAAYLHEKVWSGGAMV
jgi:hypothetical protein